MGHPQRFDRCHSSPGQHFGSQGEGTFLVTDVNLRAAGVDSSRLTALRVAELQALAARRLRGAKANFAEGRKAANEVHKDLQWTQKRVR